ncbi:MAG TPA: hypothetical protein DDY13_03570 [Cytophagales bacterium]|nr:hypothetical protein [Cytophagales bacterium]
MIYRPFDDLNISIEGNYEANTNKMQYITTESVDNQNYYLLGRIDQKTLGVSMRFTYNINPDLSIQF